MRLRILLAVAASLLFASAAGATCSICVDYGGGEGRCYASSNGYCSESCCLSDPGAPCIAWEYLYPCAEGFGNMPSAYFGTKLPLLTEGSALRLRLGKGIRPERTCSAPTLPRQARSTRKT